MGVDYQGLIHATIKTIVNQFHRKPDNFFNEHEFHQYCYHAFYRQKEFSKQYKTKDGKWTNILHPEYPTLQRFSRKNIGLYPKGIRARYDMAILKPVFIEKNKFEKVRCRDIKQFKDPKDFKSKNLIAAIEFKYIIEHGQKYINEIKYDHFKLKCAKEVELKYLLVFSNTIEKYIDYFEKLKDDKKIKKIFIAVFEKNGKKEMEIKQYPKDWLDLKT